MDKGLVVVAIACIAMLAFFVGYQLFATDQPNVEPVDNGGDVEDDVWDSSMIVNVELKGDSIAVSSSRPAIVNGSRMTIKSAGTYNITGSLADGQIIVYTKDKGVVRLILNGVSINCSTSSPICVLDADEVVLFLEAGTQNFVSDASSYVFDNPTEHEPNAAIFSKSDLTILGNGSLGVVGNYNDGIASKDGLVIRSGIITVRSVDDGIRGKDYLVIKGGNIDLDVGGDGLKSDNAVNSTLGYVSVVDGVISIRSGGDAVQAETSVLISGGSFNLTSGGGSGGVVVGDVSAKGIKGVVSVVVDGGTFMISSADDAIHSNGNVTINGGIFTLSSGDDAIHADGSVQVNGGDITIVDSIWVDPGGEPWDSSIVVNVELKGDSITVSHSRPAIVDGSKVIIRSAGTYNITGYLTDGQIIVYTQDAGPVKLILNGVNINCSTSSPICVLDAAEVVMFLPAGTENSVGDGASYVLASPSVDEPNAAVFSKDDLTISGDGLLRVVGNYNDGIASKDGLVIESGTLIVSSVDDGIRGKDYLIVKGGNLDLDVGGDGLKSDNAEDAKLGYVSVENGVIDIKSGGDAFQAETRVLITGGSFHLVSGGGSSRTVSGGLSAKGIKGTVGVTIDAGSFVIDSADDAIHSNGNVTINGGSLVLSTGDDGIHADSSIKINNGEIKITKSYEGIESDVVTINGGNIHVVSRDDGVNVGPDSGFFPGGGSTYSGSYYLYVNGGYLAVNALGDGIDSNGAIVMTGGYVIVDGPSDDMNGALDHVACNVTGGFLLAVGSSGMAQAPGPLSTQYSVLLNFRSRYQAGTLIHVQASDGTEVFTFLPTKQFQSVAFSLPSLARGITYDVYVGGSYSGTVNDGLCSGGTYTPGSKYTSFTISSIVTQIGSGGGFFPGF